MLLLWINKRKKELGKRMLKRREKKEENMKRSLTSGHPRSTDLKQCFVLESSGIMSRSSRKAEDLVKAVMPSM